MIISKNPYTEETLAIFEELTSEEIENKIHTADTVFSTWKQITLQEKKILVSKFSSLLENKKNELATIITHEIGRPIKESISEIDKSIKICEYYLNNINQILAPELVKTSSKESYIVYEPMGVILAVMPWNFPFTQVLRFAIPAVLAGNIVLLKHASNVPQCADAIEKIFNEAGFPKGVFQNLFISSDKVEKIIRDPRIKGVTLTGSEKAGSSVASIAGSEIKKTVMELGGSDPFIIFNDADLDKTINAAVSARLKNNGQACNAAKRFIVLKEISNEFIKRLVNEYEKLIIGNPMDENTQLGTLATEKGLLEVESQVQRSLDLGAKLEIGGERLQSKGYFYKPTILSEVRKGMPAYDEEIFGPVAAIIVVDSIEDAIRAANDTKFGLGASIWTQNIELAKKLVTDIEAGSVFINKTVNSDPALPFGGIKKSGYGREFSHYGPKEFMNVKSIVIEE